MMKKLLRIGCVMLSLIFAAGAAPAEQETEPAPAELPAAAEEETEPAPAEENPLLSAEDSGEQEVLQQEKPGRLSGLVIGIDPGHQARGNSEQEPIAPGSDVMKAKVSSGTGGVATGIDEYITNLEIGLKLRDALEAAGTRVYMTREVNEIDISNVERALMMNALGADLVLRLHCDGADSASVNGIAMFVRETGAMRNESREAAECLLECMCASTGAKKRYVNLSDSYTMNNWSTVPCILVEMGYMSNPDEDRRLNDGDYQDLLVQGMLDGIAMYFERE